MKTFKVYDSNKEFIDVIQGEDIHDITDDLIEIVVYDMKGDDRFDKYEITASTPCWHCTVDNEIFHTSYEVYSMEGIACPKYRDQNTLVDYEVHEFEGDI